MAAPTGPELHRHEVAALDRLERRAGDLRGDGLHDRFWAELVVGAGDRQHRAGDAGQCGRQVGVDQHAVDGGVAAGVVGEPAGAEDAVLLGVVANLGRVGAGEAVCHGGAHAGGFQGGHAVQHGGAAVRGHAGGGGHGDDRGGAPRIGAGEGEGDAGADGAAGEGDLALEIQGVEQSGDVGGHGGEGEGAARLLGLAGAAGVVAEDAAAREQGRQHLVPAFQRATHLVHQDKSGGAVALQVIAQRGVVDVNPVHRWGFLTLCSDWV